LPVTTPDEAIEKLDWYAERWKIELFHKISKSGSRAEDARLRTAERLANLIAIFCVLSCRLFWMTMINRAAPDASPRLVLTDVEIALIDRLAAYRTNEPPGRTLSDYLTQIARLAGYLARAIHRLATSSSGEDGPSLWTPKSAPTSALPLVGN
jgi:hypothetical protein